jgi:peptide-methionine (S)-S-oxide reductase
MEFHMRLALAALLLATLTAPALAEKETAIIAGGCFWCVESDMDKVKGVISTTSGYAGGTKKNPTYEDHEGYIEAVKVEFDNSVVSYDVIVNHFLRTIDVTDADGQFCDRGYSYLSGLFPLSDAQKKTAAAALKRAEKDLGQKVATEIQPRSTFYDAEDYHQDYYKGGKLKVTRFGIIEQAEAYKRYRKGCGRDARVKEVWGDKAFSFPVGAGS